LLIHLGFVLRPLLRTRFLFLTLTPACSCVYICKFQFRPIHPPPLGDYHKEIIIGNAREADENNKISCRKVVAEKTPDEGETLKVTITASSTGGQAQTGRQAREPMLRITDGPPSRRRRSKASPDGPKTSSRRSDYT
jgi:hypothetical protein